MSKKKKYTVQSNKTREEELIASVTETREARADRLANQGNLLTRVNKKNKEQIDLQRIKKEVDNYKKGRGNYED